MKFLILLLLAIPVYAGYAYSGTVTVPAATGSTQTNFTVPITGNNTLFKTVGGGGVIQHTTTRAGVTVPTDFIVTADTTCASQTGGYNWGFEDGGTVSGIPILWVKIPSLTTGSSVVLTICIGNAAISTYQGGAVGAEYDSFTIGVWHLPPGTGTLNVNDFGPAASTGTNHGTTTTTGQIDGGASNTLSQYIDTNNTPSSLTAFTLSAWDFPGTTLTQFEVSSRNAGTTGGVFILYESGQGPEIGMSNGASISRKKWGSNQTSAWHHVVGTHAAAATTFTLYQDGVAGGATAETAVSNPANGSSVEIAAEQGTNVFLGNIDEVRLDNTERSADWVTNTRNTQITIPSIGSFTPLIQVITSPVVIF